MALILSDSYNSNEASSSSSEPPPMPGAVIAYSKNHTPGPWAWTGNTLHPVNRDPARGAVHTILTDYGPYWFEDADDAAFDAEIAADRALIEAAPLLLAALVRARDCITQDRQAVADAHMGHDNRLDEDGQHAVDQYDAVLAEMAAAIAAATTVRQGAQQ